MAPRIADAWSNHAHGTPKSNIELIQAQLLITEAGMATTEAHLIMLKVEMATLRRMLELTPVSSSSTAVVQPTIAAISHAKPSLPSTSILTPTIQCRVCGEPIPESGGAYDHHLKANIKNGTMSRRKSCFACKKADNK
jgi:hypothetical protein